MYPATHGLHDQEELDLQSLIGLLRRRKYMILGTMLLVTISAFLVVSQMTPRYTAEAGLLIENKQLRVMNIESIFSSVINLDREKMILTSTVLSERVVEKGNLLRYKEFNPQPGEKYSVLNPRKYIPREWIEALIGKESDLEKGEMTEYEKKIRASEILRNSLEINHKDNSGLLKVRVTSESPEAAAIATNQLLQEYIGEMMESRYQGTKQASKWLNDTMEEYKEKVQESENAVEEYKREIGLTESGGESIYTQQHSQHSSQFMNAKNARLDMEARISQVRKALKSGNLEAAPVEVRTSPLLQNLYLNNSKISSKISELSTIYGPKHPVMINAMAEKTKVQDEIVQEIKKIAFSLESEYEVAKKKELTMKMAMDEFQEKIGTFKKYEIELRALEREAKANRGLYESFLTRYKEVNSQPDIQDIDAKIIYEATPPTTKSFPRTRLIIMMAFVFSIAIGVFFGFLMDNLESGYVNVEQVEHMTGVKTIGLVPYLESNGPIPQKPSDYILENPKSIYGESLYNIRTALTMIKENKSSKVFLVSSAEPGEGKTSFVVSLSRIAAKYGDKVVVVDCDLRKPKIQKAMTGAKWVGIADYLYGDKELEEVISKDVTGADFISVGRPFEGGAADVLASDKMKELVAKLREIYDIVILDTPPVLVVSDALVLSKLVDKTMYVVKWGKTRREAVNKGIKVISSTIEDENTLGIVLTQVNLKKYPLYDYGSHGYYNPKIYEYYKGYS
ncbi:MAG: polysaccharide biosynthesis tyrosine autokinase [Nitrospinota bacterium]|nr:polysaccharide biosynthesis tyrosine autokinase [Nitrospinota bacterium]